MLVWIWFMNIKKKLELHAKHRASKSLPSLALFFLLAKEARTKQGECRAPLVKGYMSNPWHRLRPLQAAPLVVRRRYLTEVPMPCERTHSR
jgi:hypothetical protein